MRCEERAPVGERVGELRARQYNFPNLISKDQSYNKVFGNHCRIRHRFSIQARNGGAVRDGSGSYLDQFISIPAMRLVNSSDRLSRRRLGNHSAGPEATGGEAELATEQRPGRS